MSGAVEFDFADPAVLADPFPLFRRLRDDDPAHWSPRHKAWVLTRYDDAKRACLEREALSSDRLRPFFAALPGPEAARIADIIRYLTLWMVFRDPPEHTRLRRLTARVFNASAMRGMQPAIESISAWLLDRLAERESFDFVSEFAGPLPGLVIMDMLGVPRGELARIKRLSDDMVLFLGSARAHAEKYAVAEAATAEMAAFFRDLVAARRAAPRTDLLSALVSLRDGGDRLSEDELIATCMLLLFAGHETTTNHLANGLWALLAHPGELARLRADPGLAEAAVEELLRYDGPSGAQTRVVTRDHVLHGRTLAAGDRVFVMLNAANRDPRVYADPDRLILDRTGPPHLAFGHGAHICLGFPLARLEGRIALPAVLARWQTIEPGAGAPEWIDSMVFRGMKALPLRVAPG